MTSLGKAALWYAEHGIPVFLLRPWSKEPFKDTHGFYDATTDIEQVTRWWTVNPHANIGIPTGHLSGLGVLDLDPKNGGPDRGAFFENYGSDLAHLIALESMVRRGGLVLRYRIEKK